MTSDNRVDELARENEALKASELRYRRVFESAKDGILILDAATGHVVDVNPFLLALTGHSSEDFLGKELWKVGGFKHIAASKESFAHFLTEKNVRYDDVPLEARGGKTVDVELVSNVYRAGNQDVIQWNIRDITERKRSEAERERLSMAIEQAGETVLITDASGSIVYANPAFEAVTGYTRREVLGQNPRLLKSGAQDKAFYTALWATLAAGQTWHGRLINRKKDGTLYTEEATISPVRDAAGVITSYVAVKRDITPVLVLEAQYLHAQKMEGVGRLAGGIAHDFNNLLSVILSYTEFTLDALKEGDPFREDLAEVKNAAERAATLTGQLLAFSRKQVLQPEPLNLNQVIAEMEKMLRRIIGEHIDLVRVEAPDLRLVRADPGQVEQVLMNLVVNACDAMPEGGSLTIETANAELDEQDAAHRVGVEPGSYVMLAVSDSGSGMDAETKARIFDPFFTTKEKGKGTGLGLATVYGIVKQSGGSVWVYSEPGQGSTFKIYLPRLKTEQYVPPSSYPTSPRKSTGTETILVVEDEEALRRVVQRALENAGYAVLAAASGAEALVMSAQHAAEIHLVLTDVVMPQMSGKALVHELHETGRALRVLYMSGYADEAIVHHGVLEPGTNLLSKPFSSAALTRKVREVLDGGG